MTRSNGEVVGIPCKRCGKSWRHDYDGLCMDCADELGVSEIFDPDLVKKHVSNVVESRERLREYIKTSSGTRGEGCDAAANALIEDFIADVNVVIFQLTVMQSAKGREREVN